MVKLIDFTKIPFEFGGADPQDGAHKNLFVNVITTAIAANHPTGDLETMSKFYALVNKIQNSENLLELDERELDLIHKELQDCKQFPISLLMSAPVVGKVIADLKYQKASGE